MQSARGTLSAFAARSRTTTSTNSNDGRYGEEAASGAVSPAVLSDVEPPKKKLRTVKSSFSPLLNGVNSPHLLEPKQIRELETATEIHVTLGQTVTIAGLCSMWVKEGAVSIDGAFIRQSEKAHRVYSPTTHALLQIQGVSQNATFELASIEDGVRFLPNIGLRGIFGPSSVDLWESKSFYLHGYSFDINKTRLGRPLRQLDLAQWDALSDALALSALTGAKQRRKSRNEVTYAGEKREHSDRPPLRPCILFVGEYSTGISAISKCTLNRMVTAIHGPSELLTNMRGVLLLDLDKNEPELAPPGCLYLAQVEEPILGPAFTHYLTQPSGHNQILRMHHIHTGWSDGIAEFLKSACLDLLELACNDSLRDMPLIINAPSWLVQNSPGILKIIAERVQLTEVVSLDVPNRSTYSDLSVEVSGGGGFRLHTFSQERREKITESRQLENLNLQSYCHIIRYRADHPLWFSTPVHISEPTLQLKYHPAESHIWTVTGSTFDHAVEVVQLLRNSTVAIMAMEDSHAQELTQGNRSIIIPALPWRPPYLLLNRDSNPFEPARSECLGLAYVKSVGIEDIFMHTPVLIGTIEARIMRGFKIVLALAGRAEWAQLESVQTVKSQMSMAD